METCYVRRTRQPSSRRIWVGRARIGEVMFRVGKKKYLIPVLLGGLFLLHFGFFYLISAFAG